MEENHSIPEESVPQTGDPADHVDVFKIDPEKPMILTHFPPRYPKLGSAFYIALVIVYIVGLSMMLGKNSLHWGIAILCVCCLMNYRGFRKVLKIDNIKNPTIRSTVSVIFIFLVAFVGFMLNQILSVAMLIILIPVGNDVLSLYYNMKIDRLKGIVQTLAMTGVILAEILIVISMSSIFA